MLGHPELEVADEEEHEEEQEYAAGWKAYLRKWKRGEPPG